MTSNGQQNKNVHFYRLRWLNFRLLKKLYLMWKHQLRSITEECIDKLIFIEMKCQFYTKPTANGLVRMDWKSNKFASNFIVQYGNKIIQLDHLIICMFTEKKCDTHWNVFSSSISCCTSFRLFVAVPTHICWFENNSYTINFTTILTTNQQVKS